MDAYRSFNRIRVYILGITLCLAAGSLATNALAARVTLAWSPNTESDLAGYRIHYGTASGSYTSHIDVHNVTTYAVEGLTAGQTYYFAASAYDSAGNESGYSSQVSHSIPQTSTPGAKDADGDGVPDTLDAFPNDAKEWVDANENGIGDYADAAANQTRPAPNAPVLASPVNDAVADTMVVLKTGPFSTTATGTTHAKTRWQVFGDEDDVCVLDILSTTALTGLGVPWLVLNEGTPYFWRAQHVDSSGAASGWSDHGYFSTQTTDRDRNANGVPDAQEAPRLADLNRDRVKDYRQTSIKSVMMEGTGAQIGVSIKKTPTALAIEAVESEDPGRLDPSAAGKPGSLPFGLIGFKIAVAKPGDLAGVALYFSGAAPSGGKWYLFDTASGSWADFSTYANFAGDRRSLVLTLTDGGPGDADGVANGVIVDSGGIGVSNDAIFKRSKRSRGRG